MACGAFPDQGSNLCPLHWQVDSYPLCHQGSSAGEWFKEIPTVSAGREERGGRVQVELSWPLKDMMNGGEKKTFFCTNEFCWDFLRLKTPKSSFQTCELQSFYLTSILRRLSVFSILPLGSDVCRLLSCLNTQRVALSYLLASSAGRQNAWTRLNFPSALSFPLAAIHSQGEKSMER